MTDNHHNNNNNNKRRKIAESNHNNTLTSGPINDAPNEIMVKILTWLPLHQLSKQHSVSKKFNIFANDVWQHFHLQNVPASFVKNHPAPSTLTSANQQVRYFESEYIKIASYYPNEIVGILGAKNIAYLPLSLTPISMYYNESEAFGCHHINIEPFIPIVKHYGRIDLYAQVNNPNKTQLNITFKVNNLLLTPQPPLYSIHKNPLRTYKWGGQGNLLPCSKPTSPSKIQSFSIDDIVALAYLGRLARNEPCGLVVHGIETEPKTAADGVTPLVQLCDDNGNVLDFSANLPSKKSKI